MMHIGTLSQKSVSFDYRSNPKLTEALQKKLFEDTKDTIKLSKLSIGANVVDKDIQEKIDSIKTRLINQYGYCEHCATDILHYAASIFARGDLIESQNN
jgi:serine protein kinase